MSNKNDSTDEFHCSFSTSQEQDNICTPEEKLMKLSKCTNCGYEGPTGQDFSVRSMRGRYVVQSWCKPCRRAGVKKVS